MHNTTNGHYAIDYGENVHSVSFKENISAEFGYIVQKDKTLHADTLLQINYLTNFFQS